MDIHLPKDASREAHDSNEHRDVYMVGCRQCDADWHRDYVERFDPEPVRSDRSDRSANQVTIAECASTMDRAAMVATAADRP